MELPKFNKKGGVEWYWIIIGIVIIIVVAIFLLIMFTEYGAGVRDAFDNLMRIGTDTSTL